jgi:hypothetical protein
MSRRSRERHYCFFEAINDIEVVIYFNFKCAICGLHKKDKGGRLEYMRPRDDMEVKMTMCCGMLVCRDCAKSNLLTHCNFCSKKTKLGWQTKRGRGWKKRYLEHVEIHRMWQVKPLLAHFCSKYFKGVWHDMVKIIQDGNQQKIESFEKQYIRYLNEITHIEYVLFGLRTSFKCVPFVYRTSKMFSWLDVSELICQNVGSRRYIILRRHNLFNMFLNGIVKMLAKKCCDEKVVKISGKTKIRTKIFFFYWILKRVLSKRLL